MGETRGGSGVVGGRGVESSCGHVSLTVVSKEWETTFASLHVASSAIEAIRSRIVRELVLPALAPPGLPTRLLVRLLPGLLGSHALSNAPRATLFSLGDGGPRPLVVQDCPSLPPTPMVPVNAPGSADLPPLSALAQGCKSSVRASAPAPPVLPPLPLLARGGGVVGSALCEVAATSIRSERA